MGAVSGFFGVVDWYLTNECDKAGKRVIPLGREEFDGRAACEIDLVKIKAEREATEFDIDALRTLLPIKRPVRSKWNAGLTKNMLKTCPLKAGLLIVE